MMKDRAVKALAIDLFCGLGGWAEGLMAEGYGVIGFDIEAHRYGDHRYPGTLVIQDVLTLHGSQIRDAALIVASPPCQFFSWTAMPWSIAKQRAAEVRADPALLEKELALFNACFRIQREACAAAGRHIPLIVENVRGAQPWVGRARWNFGSYYLWGDVPALMPIRGVFKSSGMNWSDRTKRGQDFTRIAGAQSVNRVKIGNGAKVEGIGWTGFAATGASWRNREGVAENGLKCGGSWWNDSTNNLIRKAGSKSPARKAASAMIAKIPAPLARHIARTYHPGHNPLLEVA